MGLGFVSAVFGNIPLTALAFEAGRLRLGLPRLSVGFGGSMIWFGSSAGFFVLLFVLGWYPNPPHKARAAALEPPVASAAAAPVD